MRVTVVRERACHSIARHHVHTHSHLGAISRCWSTKKEPEERREHRHPVFRIELGSLELWGGTMAGLHHPFYKNIHLGEKICIFTYNNCLYPEYGNMTKSSFFITPHTLKRQWIKIVKSPLKRVKSHPQSFYVFPINLFLFRLGPFLKKLQLNHFPF